MNNKPEQTAGRKLPGHLRMECIYLLRGHRQRRYALRDHQMLTEGELRKYRAVERALLYIEPALREPLIRALTTRTAYEYLDVPCGRQTFYRRRQELIAAIAREMNYIA